MKTSLVITSISAPNKILKEFAKGCSTHNWDYVLIGDTATPADFEIRNSNYFGLAAQQKMPFKLAKTLPISHYARKNLGYLQAMRNGSQVIVESDDDNLPLKAFWPERVQRINCASVEKAGWTNVYSYFTKKHIWPRGFPLGEVLVSSAPVKPTKPLLKNCPIQQGLTNGDPDVDAVYRLTINSTITFQPEPKHIALGKQTWCPFNSQNTTWFKDAFPLLYLPSHCDFRMTDIWRSFVAQRICWENDWTISFHHPTALQKRNYHNLLKDFQGEIIGYLHNNNICQKLEKIRLRGGKHNIEDDMMSCYQEFIAMNLIPKSELKLLKTWLKDLGPLL